MSVGGQRSESGTSPTYLAAHMYKGSEAAKIVVLIIENSGMSLYGSRLDIWDHANCRIDTTQCVNFCAGNPCHLVQHEDTHSRKGCELPFDIIEMFSSPEMSGNRS